MRLEDSCKHTEDLYSKQQLQMRPLLDVMINRRVWEEVTARGEHKAREASSMIERMECFYCLKQSGAVENYLLSRTPLGPFKRCLPVWKNMSLGLFNFL